MSKILIIEKSAHSALLLSQFCILRQLSVPFTALVSPALVAKSPEILNYRSSTSVIKICSFDEYNAVRDCRPIKLIIVNTFEHLPISFLSFFPRDVDVFVYLHNCNSALPYLGFFPYLSFFSALLQSFKSFSFLKFSSSFLYYALLYKARRKFLSYNNTKFLLMHSNMKEFIVNRSNIDQSKLSLVPFRTLDFHQNTPSRNSNSHYSRIITFGNIDFTRRNYSLGFKLFSILKQMNIEIEWFILGQYSNQYCRSQIDKLSRQYDFKPTIVGGENRISASDASALIAESDFLLPLHFRNVRVGCFREIFSVTKASGVEYDSLVYGKYSLLASWYKPHSLLEPLSLFYVDVDSLANMLISFYSSNDQAFNIDPNIINSVNNTLVMQFSSIINPISD